MKFRTVASHGPDSPYQMMWFGMTDHTGTHIDAPLHFVPGGKPIDEADLSALYSMPAGFLLMGIQAILRCVDEIAKNV